MLPPQRKPYWYRLTPARFFAGLLVLQVSLLLSKKFKWFWFDEHKGWTVLIAVGVVGLAVLLMLFWGLVCLCLRRQFQFSLRSLLLFLVVVSVPLGWFAWEVRRATKQKDAVEVIVKTRGIVGWFAWELESARRQREAVARITAVGGLAWYDYVYDEYGNATRATGPTALAWLRTLLGDEQGPSSTVRRRKSS
jgi:hypothetical protein